MISTIAKWGIVRRWLVVIGCVRQLIGKERSPQSIFFDKKRSLFCLTFNYNFLLTTIQLECCIWFIICLQQPHGLFWS
ncbi:MAG TPA: hypothetical protein V6C71_24450 [Coleofasciculaceae cyanobacterium]